jgi:hypothetical protein
MSESTKQGWTQLIESIRHIPVQAIFDREGGEHRHECRTG